MRIAAAETSCVADGDQLVPLGAFEKASMA